MYETHWGLKESPFPSSPKTASFHPSPTHEEALARLHFLVERHRRLGLLLGSGGSGKTLLLRFFEGLLRRGGAAVVLQNLLGVGQEEFLPLLADRLGLAPRDAARPAALWRMVNDRLAEYRYEQRDTVLLFDDADRAESAVLGQLVRLVKHDVAPDSRLTVLLAVRPGRVKRLGRQLVELAELKIELEPWEAGDTQEFLTRSLARAGCNQPAFDASATERLHELTGGVPRRVSQLADLSLMAGAGAGLPQIDAETVEAVHQELAVM